MTPGTLEHACPQCGAPVELSDTAALFDCPFCRARLAIVHGGAPALYIPPHAKAQNPVYLPYWRLRGIVLCADLPGVHGRLFDASLAAHQVSGPPATLGLRPQAMTLRFVEPHTPGVFLAPTASASTLRRAQTTGQGRITACLAESTSLVFLPVTTQHGRLVDGISGDDLGPTPEALASEHQRYTPTLSFQAAICPQCAFELVGDAASRVQFCHHCQTVWEVTTQGIAPCTVRFAARPEDTVDVWLPFWTMEVHTAGFSLQTWADLVELTGLPRVVQPWMRSRAFHFRIPAFKIRPDLFTLLTQQASLSPLAAESPKTFPLEPLFPVTLAPQEAARILAVALVALSPVRKRLLERIHGGRIQPVAYAVEYLPFVRTISELLQPDLNFALPVSAVTWARSL